MVSVITLAFELVIKAFLNELTLGSSKTEAVDIAFIGLFTLAFIYDLGHSKRLKRFSLPLSLGYMFRIALLLFDRYGRNIFTLPNSNSDSEGFYYYSVLYANGTNTTNMGSFPHLMGTIFKFIGTSRLYGQFIIALFSVVSLIVLSFIIRDLEIEEANKSKTMYIISLIPNWAILSIVFMRESIITMLVTLSVYMFYQWFKEGKSISFILSFIIVFAASSFHSGCVALAIGYTTVLLLFDRQSKSFRLKAKNLIFAVFFLIVVSFLYINYNNVFFEKMKRVDDITDIANMHEEGESSYARYVGSSNNPVSMIIYTPLRIVFFLFSPFPWQFRGVNDIIAFVFNSLFYLYTSWCDIRFLRSKASRNRALVIALTIIIISTVFVFAWGVANTGTACRHRDKIIIIWGLLLALTYNPNLSCDSNHSYSINKH